MSSSFDVGEPVGDYLAVFVVTDGVANITREVRYMINASAAS